MSQTVAIAIVALLLTLALAGGTVYALRFSPRARVKRRVAAIVRRAAALVRVGRAAIVLVPIPSARPSRPN